MHSLSNKVVVVTGACGGIGTQTVFHFAKHRANLVLVDIDDESLETTAALCKKEAPIDVLTVTADLTKEREIDSVVKKTIEHFKRVDVLVNNAGIGFEKRLAEISWEEYDKVMNINLKAAFFLMKGFMPELIKTKGCVVNTSSVAGHLPSALHCVYALSKAGLNHLTRIAAQENGRHGVRVNAICPSAVDTKMTGTEENPKFVRLMAKSLQPLCGLIPPGQIAAWIVWLASDESGPITGQTVSVDGGSGVTRIPSDYTLPKKV